MDPTKTPTEPTPDIDYTHPIHRTGEEAFAAVIRNRSGFDAGDIDSVLRDLSGLTDLDKIEVVNSLWLLYRAACRETGETPRKSPIPDAIRELQANLGYACERRLMDAELPMHDANDDGFVWRLVRRFSENEWYAKQLVKCGWWEQNPEAIELYRPLKERNNPNPHAATRQEQVMKNETMKPCPFCGGDAEIIQRSIGTLYDLGCSDQNCIGYQLMLPSGDDIDGCIAAWNRRAPLPANVAEAVGRLGPKLRIHSELGEPIYLGLSKPEVADLSAILKHLTEPTHENE